MIFQKINKSDVLQKNGVYVHASSVSVSGRALLFLGHSTAGKSTISQLLKKKYPLIADDKVLISKALKNGWHVRDASGKFRGIAWTEYPLGRKKYLLFAVIRIFKGRNIQIHPLTKKETCKYFLDAIFENDFQRNLDDLEVKKTWFKLAAAISRDIEGWHLTFPKNRSIIQKINDNFEKRIN